jgi:hypothetical protein
MLHCSNTNAEFACRAVYPRTPAVVVVMIDPRHGPVLSNRQTIGNPHFTQPRPSDWRGISGGT